jgi:spermidine/putrescine-binding protein
MEFFSMKYDGSVPMKTFLGRVTGVTERLKRFYGIDVSDEQTMARMISALPTEYSGLIRTLNDTPPSRMTLDYMEKKILVEDGMVLAEKAKRGEISVASTYGNTSALAANSNSDVTCENCGGGGHTKARCWHKGGDLEGQYPDWWKGKRETSTVVVPRTHMAYDMTVVL